MPITPHFHLSQTLTHVGVEIRVPHVRVSVESVEVLVDREKLHFSSPPYLLILQFPAPFAETDASESAKYDPSRDGGVITLDLKKQEPELWPDLDLLGQLMRPKMPSSHKPLRAEVVSEERNEADNQEETIEDPLPPNVLDEDKPHYGFLNQSVGVFTDLVREGLAAEMLQLPNPDETDSNDRRKLRLEAEEETFDADRYLGDVDIEDDYIYQCAMAMEPHWALSVDLLTQQMATMTTTEQHPMYFTEEESAKLASIAYPILPAGIDDQQQRSLLLGLLDILFAYVYDHLLTDGDPSIESSWTVSSLSCTLSWLESFGSTDGLHDVIGFSSRRSLIYPYIRNYDFALYCWNQVAAIIRNGRRCVIRCLLHTRAILDKSEFHYMGNRFYIDPYLGWIQSRLSDETLIVFSKELLEIPKKTCWISKEMLGLKLVDLEQLLCQDEGGGEESGDEDDGSDDNDDDDDSDDDGADSDDGDDDGDDDEANKKALIVTRDSLYTGHMAVSSALLDSEIGSPGGMLQIGDEGRNSAIETPEPPTVPVKSLIQEL